jgi:hypothetical protein
MSGTFDLEALSVTVIINGAPIDVSSGLTIDTDFLKISKDTAEEVKSRMGTKNESYTVNSIEDKTRTVELIYVPSSPAVIVLQSLRGTKKPFGIFIKNSSDPKYVFKSDNCIVKEEPETVVHGKDGFKDYTFKIKCMDSDQVWL